MNVLIIDDERKSRELLKEMLNSYCKQIKQVYLASNTMDARTLLAQKNIYLIFLDIEMPGENGIEFLSQFDRIPFEVIFTTAYKKYALDAFHFGAADYLLKPYNPERLIKAFDRILSSFNTQNKEAPSFSKISIPTMKGFTIIDIKDIEYLRAEGNYTRINFVSQNSVIVSKNLKRFEEQLPTDIFFRVHRSIIINMQYIKNYEKGRTAHIIVQSGAKLEVSNNKREEIISLLNIIE